MSEAGDTRKKDDTWVIDEWIRKRGEILWDIVQDRKVNLYLKKMKNVKW